MQGELQKADTLFRTKGNMYCRVENCYINPLRAKFFMGNIKLYLQYLSFLHTDTKQAVEPWDTRTYVLP